ncbi:hypothetical protein QOZ80_8BG0664600 [Eleusine coracana subsp. coracana]|nr:hypothetical protein QOZ80_8BG0664600 [Eleusine coracana subsp. coracana]
MRLACLVADAPRQRYDGHGRRHAQDYIPLARRAEIAYTVVGPAFCFVSPSPKLLAIPLVPRQHSRRCSATAEPIVQDMRYCSIPFRGYKYPPASSPCSPHKNRPGEWTCSVSSPVAAASMARFLVPVLLAAVALLTAARTGHAAPSSTAEMLWRAVLESAVAPDAVLRRIRTGHDTSLVNKGVDGGMAKEGAGRSPSGLDYNDYTRLPPAAGKAAPSGHGYKAAPTPSEGAGVREDDGPFGYDYKAPTSGANKARDDDDDDVPFNYSYKAPSEAATSESESGDKESVSAPYNYSSYNAPGDGEAATSSESKKEESAGAPYNYGYMSPSERHAATMTTTTVFFHEESVRVGARLRFRFPAFSPAPLGLLPRRAASSVPFSVAALPAILALFRVPPSSAQAAAMAATLRTCEWPPLAGEAKFCASSLEALVERAMATLGTRDVRAVTSTLPRGGAPLREYAVRAVRRVEDGGAGFFVACHDEAYPYTVYRCHTTGPARAYMVEMEGYGGDKISVATVCHTDTSRWNPEHLSFKLLGTRPGGAPICHLMPYGHIIWAKNVESSPA